MVLTRVLKFVDFIRCISVLRGNDDAVNAVV